MIKLLHNLKYYAIAATLAIPLTVTQLLGRPVQAANSVNIIFPVIGSVSFSDDYTSPRGDDTHKATDIIASKMQPVVSASDGVIEYVTTWSGAGYAIRIKGNDGYTYNYYHLNNDTDGTDDGRGGYMNAFGADMERGNPVKRGQLIGYVGDSGNAEGTVPHLHFEIYDGNTPMNPYSSLVHARNDGRVLTKPASYPALDNESLPYGQTTNVPINISSTDISNTNYYVTAPSYGGGPDIRVFRASDSTRVTKFIAFDERFRGGVDVESGDINGDGKKELIVAAGKDGGPHVKIFSYRDAGYYVKTGEFFAYDKSNRDGMHVTAADVDGDSRDEIITAPKAGSGPHVKIFSYRDAGYYVKTGEFFAYEKTFRGGVDVSAGYLNDDQVAEIATGAGPSGRPEVAVFNASGKELNRFLVYDEANRSGVRLSMGDVRRAYGRDEIVVVPASNGGPQMRVINGVGTIISSSVFAESWWRDGYDIAVLDNRVTTSLGGEKRRSSVR